MVSGGNGDIVVIGYTIDDYLLDQLENIRFDTSDIDSAPFPDFSDMPHNSFAEELERQCQADREVDSKAQEIADLIRSQSD